MMSIQARAAIGDKPAEAFADACALAERLQAMIEFDFNGISCAAYPDGTGVWLETGPGRQKWYPKDFGGG